MKKRRLKKVMTGMLTGALVISGFGIGGFAQKAKADSTVEDGSLIENAVQISDYDFLYRLKAFREGSCYVHSPNIE